MVCYELYFILAILKYDKIKTPLSKSVLLQQKKNLLMLSFQIKTKEALVRTTYFVILKMYYLLKQISCSILELWYSL